MILPVKVYERVGKSVILVCRKAQMALGCIIWPRKSRENTDSGFVIYLCFEDSAFTVVKKDANFLSERGTICQLKV